MLQRMSRASRMIPFGNSNLHRPDLVKDDVTPIAELNPSKVKFLPVHGKKSFFRPVGTRSCAAFLSVPELQSLIPDVSRESGSVSLVGVEENGTEIFAVDVSSVPIEQIETSGIKSAAVFIQYDELLEESRLAEGTQMGIAHGLIHWHTHSKFCSKCGSKTEILREGTARKCSNETCKTVVFPRQDPAVITTCAAGDYLLLGRKPFYPAGRYSTVAGFVEIGETLEATVAREVEEETGVACEQDSVKYVCSQPWPFPQSYMLAFTADVKHRPDLEAEAGDKICEFEMKDDCHLDLDFLKLSHSKEAPLMTRGGGWVDGPVFGRTFLPRANPPPHELEDVIWFRWDLLDALLRVSGPVGSTPLPEGHMRIPMNTGVSYALISEFARERKEVFDAKRASL